jgi:SAM-dependent methyltransferase
MFKVFNLYTGYKPANWEPIKPKHFLEHGKFTKDTRYTLKKFLPNSVLDESVSTFYGNEDAYGQVKCKNGDDIMNNSIVEFAISEDTNTEYPLRWIPLRVRKDKTQPNDYSTAMNVWRSIEYPVTETIISGDQKVFEKMVPEDDVYYRRNIPRDKFASKYMMDFHNHWVKNHFLISQYGKQATSLLDLACGKGGDLRKWLDADIKTVYGFDVSRDNIENPVDGIYARMMSHDVSNKTYVFGTLDSSKRFDEAYITSRKSEDDQYTGNKLLKHGEFDLISCQFALHYFFGTESSLDNFVYNVQKFLKQGGHFLATCLDGNKIVSKLQPIKPMDSIMGRKDDRIMWNIQRLYESPLSTSESIPFGQEINIYMESIGKRQTEYIVDFGVLVQKFKKYDIHPVKIQSFEELYKIALTTDSKNQLFKEAIEKMSDVEKEYSFLNSIVVFRKESSSSPASKKKIIIKRPNNS